MTKIDGSGLSQDTLALIKARQGEKLNKEDVTKLEAAIVADGEINAAESRLLEALGGGESQLVIRAGQEEISLNALPADVQVAFAQVSDRLEGIKSAQQDAGQTGANEGLRSRLLELKQQLSGPQGIDAKIANARAELARASEPRSKLHLERQVQNLEKEQRLLSRSLTTLQGNLDRQEARTRERLADLGLSKDEEKVLDLNHDGSLNPDEAEAAFAIANKDGNAYLDGNERREFKQLLAERGQTTEFLQQGSGQQVQTARHGIQERLQAVQAERQTAARQLLDKGVKLPDKPAASLIAERQNLGGLNTLAARERQLAGQQSELTAAQEKLTGLKAQLAGQQTLQTKTEAALGISESKALKRNILNTSARIEILQSEDHPSVSLERLRRESSALDQRRDQLLRGQATPADLQAAIDKNHAQIEILESLLAKSGNGRGGIDGSQLREQIEKQLAFDQAALPGFEADLAAMNSQLASQNQQGGSIAGLTAQIRETEAQIRQLPTQQQLDATRTELTAIRTRLESLDLQIPYAQAAEKDAGLQLQEATAGKLDDKAQRLEAGLRVSQDAGNEALALLSRAETVMQETEAPTRQSITADLDKARQLKSMIEEGKLDGSVVDQAKLDRTIEQNGTVVADWKQRMEGEAESLIRQFKDPAFQKALSSLPEAQQADIMGRFSKLMVNTKNGREFIDKTIVPALEAPTQDSFWLGMFGKGKDSYEIGLNVIQAMGGYLTARENGAKVFESALLLTLGLRDKQVLDGVTNFLNSARPANNIIADEAAKDLAKDLLKNSSKYQQLGGKLEAIADTLKVAETCFKLYQLYQEPELKSALDAGKSVAEVSAIAAKLLENTKYAGVAESIGKYGAGVVAPILEGTLSGFALYEKNGTIDRGDEGGTLGHSLIMGGSVVALAGFAADGTVVGAVAGVPLTIIGGLIAGTGKVINMVAEDGADEKWVKDKAPEYLRE